MKKIIYILLFVVVISLAWFVLQNKNSPSALDEYYASMDRGVDMELSDYRLEANGVTATLYYPRTKVGDIYVNKTITYNEDGSGEIALALEGDGDYIEIIPKSFAEHVDDLEFSVKPDEIIDEDPIVKWMIDTIENKITKIVIKVKKVAYREGKKTGTSQGFAGLEKTFLSGEFDFSKVKKEAQKAGLEAGMKAGANEMINHLEDFVFISDLSICANMKSYKDQYSCLMLSIDKHPNWYDCKNIFPESTGMQAQCESVQQNDPTLCEKLALQDFDAGEDLEYFEELCIVNFFITKGLACHNLADDAKELCITDLVKKTEFKEGCNELSADAKKRCLLVNGEKLDNEEIEEPKEDDTFDIGFNCPTPTGAIHEVVSYYDRWKDENGKKVGLHQHFYDYKREKIRYAICYNAESEMQGMAKWWRSDGTLKKICTYENNVEISCEDIEEPKDDTPFVPIGDEACAEREKNCKGTNPLSAFATTEIPTVTCNCINNKIITCTDDQCSEMTDEKKELICLSLKDRCLNPMIDQAVMWEYGFKCECIGNVITSCTDGMCE